MSDARFASAALKDLGAISNYIAVDNPKAAQQLIADIETICDLLAEFPRIGQLRNDLGRKSASFRFGKRMP